MFPVKLSIQNRKTKIKSFLTDDDAAISVLLAASYFEWTVSRIILFCGQNDISTIRKKLKYTHGLQSYKDVWKDEISSNPTNDVEPLAIAILNWSDFYKSFQLRHKLIHGKENCSKAYAKSRVEDILKAVDYLYAITEAKGLDIHAKLDQRTWRNCRISKD